MFEVQAFVRGEREEHEWDQFVMEESINGTFLQTRNFLNYHPEGRFADCSIVIREQKNKMIAAVCPACAVKTQTGETEIWAHKGSTFGGLVFAKRYHSAAKILELIDAAEAHWKSLGAVRVYYKQTGNLFTSGEDALHEYCFSHAGYKQYTELNTYIDFTHYKDPVISNFSRGKAAHVRKALKYDLFSQLLQTREQLEDFYVLLTENLKKYDTKPVHTLAELEDFRTKRLVDHVEFHGIWSRQDPEKLLAGSMLFLYKKGEIAHSQYLAGDLEPFDFSPASYLYYALVEHCRQQGYRILSWGIATEDQGRYLNEALLTSKEGYGSKHALNRTFWKNL